MRSLRAVAVGAAAVSVAACQGDHNPNPGSVTPPPTPPDLPRLVISAPERGAFVTGPVTVTGRAIAGTGALTTLTVAGEPVPLDADGGFTTTLTPPPGLLLLGARVEDDLGQRAVDGRGLQVGEVNPEGTTLPGALALRLGPTLLDNDTPTADDFAAVAEALLLDPAFADTLVGARFGSTIQGTLTGVTLGDAAVDITPQEGLMAFDVTVTNFDTTFTTDLGIDGTTHADAAFVHVDLSVSPGPSGVVITTPTVTATLSGFSWEASWVPFWAESIFNDTVQGLVQTSLEDQVRAQVPALLGDLLSAFSFDLPIGATAVALELTLADARAHPDGLVLELDAKVTAPSGSVLPTGAGSLRTNVPMPASMLQTSAPVALAIDDDLVNQLLFAVWHAGIVEDVTLTGTELLLLSGQALPPPLGPVDHVVLNLGLPPVLSPSGRDSDGDFSADLAVGELSVDLIRDDGQHLTVSLNTRAGANLAVVNSGLVLALDDRPREVTVEAGLTEWPRALDPGDLASLFRLSTPGLVGSAVGFLPALPTPSVPIGDLTGVPSLAGVAWTFAGADATMHDSGWLQITGTLQ